MKALEERILKEGRAIGNDILKVDSFINHQLDIRFMEEIGKEMARLFSDVKVDKILTVEASGIAIASVAARYFDYPPVVFAKKSQPNTMNDDCYTAEAKSFTKGNMCVYRVSKTYIKKGENILIVDDFMASGEASVALAGIVESGGANVAGITSVIEKEYQGGSERLRKMGYLVRNLAVIKKIDSGVITFAEK
ncbi:MAG: xanthine phosphoribosyltransferase [Clostridia bacterium]|nr:xanthine phosphoribosyltransferase [Clostridia bacterium]